MIETGTVIHGTLRNEDLIWAFINVLPDGPERQKYIREARALNGKYENLRAGFLLEDLFAYLDILAPAGYYFGTLEGDGSDFGFWPVEEDAQPAEPLLATFVSAAGVGCLGCLATITDGFVDEDGNHYCLSCVAE